ncbi:unnamed protein product (macronuclear) [Paramecium tetraurelia]|uniref:Myb-like domain-containing protein n=1 Tax=Paramecium tetraurelia TaxID=5888 RepID=A0BT68_PARTE|nr:uncharacterized protein GSPATT00031967001 [Paramecium tetraurelia]CAK61735.1 unnamed protein product [Paramecium tetraurelia]|eukprot:XP_001429133.1 hypothetical protein (macronuclear) [Paramecium tetraurelia strain d4-2]
MEDICVLNLLPFASLSVENQYPRQNELSDSLSSQGTNNQGEQSCTLNETSKKSQVTKKKISKEQPQDVKKNQGHWSTQEHLIYVEFLKQHQNTTMQNQQNRKNNKIFKLMSMTIGTRSPSQCRSHHQKFNPFTLAGQKRNKKNKKRINAENITYANEVQQYYTPEIKSQINPCHFEYLSNNEDSRPQLQNFCCNSNDDSDNCYRNDYQYLEELIN